jgi:pimeloyl-ACP methyl ester carboxylesterase
LKSELVEVNGAQIYREVRGSGPPLLLIVGLTGDAGWFEPLARLLAARFTVVTYDRRANSRSPRPQGWTSTSIAEQADDAAALLSDLRLAPALVFGNSLGAVIALELLIRHPEVVRRTIAHEPALYSLCPCAQDLTGFWQARVTTGGPRYAMTVLTGMNEDDVIPGLDPGLVHRVFSNSETLFSMEMPPLLDYAPDAKAVMESGVPIIVAAGAATSMFYYGASRWLARGLGTDLCELPGDHTGFANRPEGFAAALTPLLER